MLNMCFAFFIWRGRRGDENVQLVDGMVVMA